MMVEPVPATDHDESLGEIEDVRSLYYGCICMQLELCLHANATLLQKCSAPPLRLANSPFRGITGWQSWLLTGGH